MYRCPKPDAVDRWPESLAHERFKDWERENELESSADTMVDGCGYLVYFGKIGVCCRRKST